MWSILFRLRLSFLLGGWFTCLNISAATIQWDGGGADGQWNTATNWVGDILPAAGDDVLLNNIFQAGTYTVSLPAGAVTITVNSLTISPAGANTITVLLLSTNTADPGLLVTGNGDALILNSNGRFQNSSGAATGSGLSITNTFRINNGGHYIHNTTRGNAAIVSQLSIAAGTETGRFEFDVPLASYALSLSSRNYGSLVLTSAAWAGNVTYFGSGASPCNVRGDLFINAGVNFNLSMSADFIIARNYNQTATSAFNLQTAGNNNVVRVAGNVTINGTMTESGTGISVFELNGSSQQLVDGSAGAITNSVEFRLNNPAGASLIGPITISYLASIQAGNFLLNNFNFFTNSFNSITAPSLTSNHFVTNGVGELMLVLNPATPTVFPVGPSQATYNPVTLTSPGTGNFGVRVGLGINPPISFPTYGIGRTWNISASTGAMPNVNVIFQYASADANANATQPQDMEILMYSGLAWSILSGNTNITPGGADPAWTVTTIVPITIPIAATPFALGVDGGWVLPLDCLINCSGKKINNNGIVSWTVNSCTQVGSFDLEKANADGLFKSLGKILPTSALHYDFNVGELPPGRSQYRIRINKTNGEIKYSEILSLVGERADLIVNMYPAIVNTTATVIIKAPKAEILNFSITNTSSQLVKQWQARVLVGENKIELKATEVTKGIYFLVVRSSTGTNAWKFIKE